LLCGDYSIGRKEGYGYNDVTKEISTSHAGLAWRGIFRIYRKYAAEITDCHTNQYG